MPFACSPWVSFFDGRVDNAFGAALSEAEVEALRQQGVAALQEAAAAQTCP
jgi:hypothetical protein